MGILHAGRGWWVNLGVHASWGNYRWGHLLTQVYTKATSWKPLEAFPDRRLAFGWFPLEGHLGPCGCSQASKDRDRAREETETQTETETIDNRQTLQANITDKDKELRTETEQEKRQRHRQRQRQIHTYQGCFDVWYECLNI